MAEQNNHSKMSDDELLKQLNAGNKSQSSTEQNSAITSSNTPTNTNYKMSDLSDEDLLKKLNGSSQGQDNKSGGWSSYGKGILSSIAEAPSNVGNALAHVKEGLDNLGPGVREGLNMITPFGAVNHFHPKEAYKGNEFENTANYLKEDNIANQLGRVTGDVALSVFPAAGAGKGTSVPSKILNDVYAGGTAGMLAGGPEGATLGAAGAGALSGLGRAIGMGKYGGTVSKDVYRQTPQGAVRTGTQEVPNPLQHKQPFFKDLQKAYNTGLSYVAAGAVGYGLGLPYGAATMALPGAAVALRHLPPGIANGALRYSSSTGGGAGGGLLSSVLNEQYNKQDKNGQQ